MLKDIFKITKNPKKGLLALEWVVLAYLFFTLAIMAFTYTRIENPQAMLWGRLRVLFMTVAVWCVYRMLPCKFTLLVRVGVQM